jgi:hypothetical protein
MLTGNYWGGSSGGGHMSGATAQVGGGGGWGGSVTQSSGGKQVNKNGLGIQTNQTTQQQVKTLLNNMDVGDWISGEEFNFINKQLAGALKSVTRTSNNQFSLQAKVWAKLIIRSNANITIENSTLLINKVSIPVFKVTLSGIKIPGNSINTYYLTGDKLYFYENDKLYFFPTK